MDPIRRFPVLRAGVATEDDVAVEEPLEIRIAGEPLAVVMRTPGHDVELAAGFMWTEGLLSSPSDLGGIAHCKDPDDRTMANVVNALPAAGAALAPRPARRFASSSGCGLCGKDTIESIRVRARPLADATRLPAAALSAMAAELARHQPAFRATGGLHAAALFTAAGALVALREDVGRHNAVDKLVGRAVIREELPLAGHVLVVSGRVGFEIAQKAIVAGIPVLAGVSAPSSLAIELATELGLTLVGFLREGRHNVYANAERLV